MILTFDYPSCALIDSVPFDRKKSPRLTFYRAPPVSRLTQAICSGSSHEVSLNSGNWRICFLFRPCKFNFQVPPVSWNEFFKECPHPDENQRRQLGRELGLEPKQIKFWFQNKRTQTKAQNERADNSSLRVENEKIHCENLAIGEALRNVLCPTCRGPPFGEEERQLNLQKLKIENSQLKKEYERVSQLVANYLGKSAEQIPSLSHSLNFQAEGFAVQGIQGSLSLNLGIGKSNSTMQYPLNASLDWEKSLMIETAISAMDELLRLLRVNEPLWIKSPMDGGYVLHRDSYDKLFPRSNQFKSSTAWIESSKDSGVVPMSGRHLLDMFLDAVHPDITCFKCIIFCTRNEFVCLIALFLQNKWVDIFPTIVTKARTIEVLDTRILGDQGGVLQLMYEQMHILSPLVVPREFYFLRYCQEVEPCMWVMVDISCDFFREDPRTSPPQSWKLPSGCMIEDKSNGCCEVTWVEHVEVDDQSQTHYLYRDLICGGSAFGAQRWIFTLQRMSERLACSTGSLSHELAGVIDMPEGRRSVMDLSHRMVKNFWGMLSMSGKLEFPHLGNGVHVSVRHSNEPDQPGGMIVSAASSLWLPLSCEILFNFFGNVKTRIQWDVVSDGKPVQEIVHVPCGTNPGNCISIIQPFFPTENSMLMLQESCIDPLGSLVVHAPIDLSAIKSAMHGEDSASIPILPSGFVISGDGRPDQGSMGTSSSSSIPRSGGSILTVAFQILVCDQDQVSLESVDTVTSLVTSTIQKMKAALNCSDV
ncbi:homeobox-leucine zipper protein ROC8-like isoform X3 [Diospyros lotus]|uniref:homeobox-leucine zipper protein ROC8-like isoform X3 n=1 Tax=Diospyros lotus TaxID=55363 RepID=UPI00224EE953|nr:homeobox-leucine zipper protein ROC8-like isoform X3 [Diospyros lotus]